MTNLGQRLDEMIHLLLGEYLYLHLVKILLRAIRYVFTAVAGLFPTPGVIFTVQEYLEDLGEQEVLISEAIRELKG